MQLGRWEAADGVCFGFKISILIIPQMFPSITFSHTFLLHHCSAHFLILLLDFELLVEFPLNSQKSPFMGVDVLLKRLWNSTMSSGHETAGTVYLEKYQEMMFGGLVAGHVGV